MFPRWLPLYLLGIAALTLFPFQAPDCPRPGWSLRMESVDFGANLLAFLPIGLALYRSRLWRALLLAFGLSLTIELCQRWLPRNQNVVDLLSNTLGAAIGWGIARFWTARWPGPLLRPVTRRLALWAGAIAVTATVGMSATSSPRHDFSNWESFPLVIGNSARGDRPWMGELSEIAIYDRAIGPGIQTKRAAPDDAPVLWAQGGPILWLRFAEDAATGRLDGPSGPVRFSPEIGDSTFVTQSGLTLRPSGIALEPWVSDHVSSRLREQGEMTVDLRLRAGAERQQGPARIVALGDGGRFRNFMLGQRRSGYVARIRTPANGRGGRRVEVETGNHSVTMREQQLRLIYDGSDGQLWVDGICTDDSPIAIATAPRLVGSLLGLSIVTCTALCALAVGLIVRRPYLRIGLSVLAGGAAWAVLRSLETWAHLPNFDTTAAALGVLSVVTAAPILLWRR
jgi:hypothetical protein